MQASISSPAAETQVTLRQAEALVGLPFVPGRFDCAHLAVLVQERLFGRLVGQALPHRHPVAAHSQAAAVLRWRGEMADPVDEPGTGDLVLFKAVHDADQPARWHIGTLFVEAHMQWVLHTHEGAGASVLERLADCRRRGLRVEGFYRWKAQA